MPKPPLAAIGANNAAGSPGNSRSEISTFIAPARQRSGPGAATVVGATVAVEFHRLDFAGLGARLRLEPNQALLHSHVGGRPTALAATGIGGSAEGLSGDVLNAFLTGKLPDALRPAVYQIVDSLPLTANGKIDRRALVASKDAARPPQEASPPGGDKADKADKAELKDKIAKIVADVLGHEQVDPTANYFHLGATSVHLVRIAAQVRQIIGREVPVIELFRHPSVTALTALLSKAEAPRNGTPPGDAEARARIEARRAARAGRGRSVK